VRRRLLLGLPALLLCAGALHAASTPVKPQAAVSPELLEFLADWQGSDGNWVDPMTFTHIDPAKLAKPDKPAPVPARGTATPAAALNSR
jgi:hypothetical protein